MKKTFSAIFIVLIMVAASCTQRTCPTYTQVPADQANAESEAAV